MLGNLIQNNFNFAISIFAALVFFSAGWLYIDSWKLVKKTKTPLLRGIGFILVALSFLLVSTQSEISLLVLATQILEIVGLATILISLTGEPLLSPPKSALIFFPSLAAKSLMPISTALYFSLSYAYRVKSKEGYEKQLSPISKAFLVISFSRAINLAINWINSDIVLVQSLTDKFGPLWIVEKLILLFGLIMLLKWVWGYVRFRPSPQLFLIFLSSTVTIFLATTAVFTFLLIKNIEKETLSHFGSNARLFQYSLERLQFEALTSARSVAKDSLIVNGVEGEDKEELNNSLVNYLLEQKSHTLVVTSENGIILARGEDPDKTGGSLSEETIFKKSIEGQDTSAIIQEESAKAPIMIVIASVPITNAEDEIVGTVRSGFIIDNAFVDGIKDLTDLDVTIFAGNVRSATTLSFENSSRFVGSEQTDAIIAEKVLEKGEEYLAAVDVLGIPHTVAYVPIKSLEGKTIGMIGVAKPQSALLETAEKSINATFAGSAILIAFSIPLVYFVARFMEENIEA